MAVISATVGGVNCWQFSGAVTDAELKTAWAALIANGVYTINRAIYLDDTADLTGLSGGFLVNFGTQVNPAFILHTARDKTKSTFNNFTFLQSTGLSVGARGSFVKTWNGSALADQGGGQGADGVSQKGGGTIYGVAGNPGGGDPRYLNEMAFSGLDGATIYSQEFSEQELQPSLGSTAVLKGLTFEKCFGFPQIGTPAGNVNVVVYRSTQNTQNATQYPVRQYPVSGRWASICYVDSYVTRNNADITTRVADYYGSSATNRVVTMVLNNYTRESWFGASKTAFSGLGNWNAANQFWGGVLKKLQFVGGGGAVIRAYDSRSTTAAQKCAFLESGSVDFLDASLAPTTDGTGKISLVHIGALATGGSASITRYTNQRYTFQKFGFRVSVTSVDMTAGGDNDLSAFTPVIPVEQDGIARTQAAINAATTITSFQDLLEELHVLAIGLSGSASYAGAFSGNLASFASGKLTTSFTTVNVDATAASKIAYNATTNALTIKAATLTSNDTVTEWINSGAVNLLNGATIQGLYETSVGPSSIVEITASEGSSVYIGNASTGITKLFQSGVTAGAYRLYLAPGDNAPVSRVRELYGFQRAADTITPTGGLYSFNPVDIPDVGITQTNVATVNAYTTLESPSKRYDRTAEFRLTEQGIKLGQIATRSGTSLEGTFSVVVRDDAPAVFAVVGNVMTIKAASYDADNKFVKEIVTGGGTFTAFDTELIGIDVEDANGDSSVNVQGTVGGLVDVWKCVNGTINADYETGTKIASNISAGKFRFTGTSGFKLIFYDKNSLLARDCSMNKGNYVLGWYVYDAATGGLTQSQNTDFATMVSKVNDIFADVNSVTAGFAESTDSLHALRQAVDTKPTLTDIEGSTVLAKTDAVSAVAEDIDALATDLSGIPAAVRTELATELTRLDVAVSTRSTLTPEDIPEGLTAAQVRTELSTELGRIDVAVSTRSTLTAEDVPEGLTAAEVWANPERTLTEAPGLTTGQAEQLRKVAQLHGVGVDLVVTETTRTAGDVSQTLTTDEAGSTTVSAA